MKTYKVWLKVGVDVTGDVTEEKACRIADMAISDLDGSELHVGPDGKSSLIVLETVHVEVTSSGEDDPC